MKLLNSSLGGGNFTALIIALGIICGCDTGPDGPDSLIVDEECKALVFENETGLEQSVTFQAPGAWTAETSGNWLETSPASGEAGDNEIMVRTCSVNSGEKARTATVRIISGEFSETVTVTQKGRDGVSEPEEEGINRNVTRISILENISFNERRYEYYLKYNEAGAVCDIVLVRSTSASNPSDGTFELREYTHRWTDDYSDNSVTLYAEDYHDIYESSYGEVKRYNLEIPFDENGNPLGTLMPSPYEEASDMRLMAVEYNEDNTLKMLLMTAEGFDTGYPLVAFEWNDGNIVSMRTFGEEPITVTPSGYTAPGGLDFNLFFLGTALSTIRDIILTPPTNLGKWSRNLPEAITDGTYDDSITKFEYEFDQYGRLTKASEIPEQYNSRYTFYYDEQPAPALEELDYIQNYPNE